MIINRETFDAELDAAGVDVKAYTSNGPDAGKAVLADGTIVDLLEDAHELTDGTLPDKGAADAYRRVLAAHDPRESPAQRDRRREGLALVALAVVAQKGGYQDSPAWVQGVVDSLAERVAEGV